MKTKLVPHRVRHAAAPHSRVQDPFVRLLADFGPWSDYFEDLARGSLGGIALPATEVTESAAAYQVKLDIPGVPKESVEITTEGGVLAVRASRHTKTKEGESTLEYRRSFTLPEGIKADAITATVEHGVLTLTIPKGDGRKSKKITVS